MKPEIWLALLRPLIPSWPRKRQHMNLDRFGQWLHEQALGVNHSIEIMSGELSPEIYDSIAKIFSQKPQVKVRVLTERMILCNHANETNKLVDEAFSGRAPNIELRIVLGTFPAKHVKIFDRNMAWVEDPHPPGDIQKYREGFVVNDPAKVSVCLADFEWYWKRAIPERPVCIQP